MPQFIQCTVREQSLEMGLLLFRMEKPLNGASVGTITETSETITTPLRHIIHAVGQDLWRLPSPLSLLRALFSQVFSISKDGESTFLGNLVQCLVILTMKTSPKLLIMEPYDTCLGCILTVCSRAKREQGQAFPLRGILHATAWISYSASLVERLTAFCTERNLEAYQHLEDGILAQCPTTDLVQRGSPSVMCTHQLPSHESQEH